MKKLVFSLLLFASLSCPSFAQWKLQMPVPGLTNFNDVAVLSPEVAIIVDQKQIFRTTDAGETYLPAELNCSGYFTSVYSTDNPDVVWLSSGNGQVFRSANMGVDWVEAKGADEVEYSTFYALNELKAWVSESNGLLLVTSDAGNHWDTVATGLDFSFKKLLFINDTLGFSTLSDLSANKDNSNIILRTVNGGAQWDTIVKDDISAILLLQSFEESTIWYADENKLYTSHDAGDTWNETNLPVQTAVYGMSLSATSSNEFSFLLHYNFDWDTYSAIYSTQDAGAHWEKEYSAYYTGMWSPPYDPMILNVIDNKYGISYAVGGMSHILVKKDESNWMMKSKNIMGEVWDMMFVDKNNGFGVGYGPFLLKTHDGGSTWQSENVLPDSARNNLNVWFSDLNTGFVLDFEEGLYKTTDGGNSWRNVLSQGDGYYSDLFFIDRNTGWVLTLDGNLYKTIDAGETWSKVITLEPLNHEWSKLFFIDGHTGFAAFNNNNITQENGGIVKITGGVITATSDIEDYTVVHKFSYSNNNTLWAACSRGLIYKSTDNGETWQTIEQTLGNGSHPVLDILFTSPLNGYALCDLYGLYTTEDGGEHWILDSTCLLNSFMDLSGLVFNGNDLYVYTEKAIVRNSGIVGVDELQVNELNGLTVWPNPANNSITISTTGTMTKLTVFDVRGKKVFSKKPMAEQFKMSIVSLPSGVYFIKANTGDGEVNGKFVKE